MEEQHIDFRWGIPALDSGFTTIPNFVIRNYSKLGVTYAEFAFVMHLASYKFDSPRGQSSPSLQTIAAQMGLSVRQVQRLRAGLEKTGYLQVTTRPGRTSVYDFQRLALACLELESAEAASDTPDTSVTPDTRVMSPLTPVSPPTPDTGVTPPLTPASPKEEERKKKNPEEEKILPLWETVLLELRGQMTKRTFNRWLEGATAIKTVADTLEVYVCDDYAVEWCDKRLRPAIERTVQSVMRRPGLEVVFLCGG